MVDYLVNLLIDWLIDYQLINGMYSNRSVVFRSMRFSFLSISDQLDSITVTDWMGLD